MPPPAQQQNQTQTQTQTQMQQQSQQPSQQAAQALPQVIIPIIPPIGPVPGPLPTVPAMAAVAPVPTSAAGEVAAGQAPQAQGLSWNATMAGQRRSYGGGW